MVLSAVFIKEEQTKEMQNSGEIIIRGMIGSDLHY